MLCDLTDDIPFLPNVQLVAVRGSGITLQDVICHL